MPAVRLLRYLNMRGDTGQETQRANGAGIKAEIRALDPAGVVQLVIETLQAQIVRILHLSTAEIDPDRSVIDLGMGSLMGMELGMVIEECFEVKLPVMMLAEGTTVRSLMQKIAESVHAGATDGQGAGVADDVEQQSALLSAIRGSEISSDELRRMVRGVTTSRAVANVLTKTTS